LTSFQSYILSLMTHNFNIWEKGFIIILTMISVLPYLTVFYMFKKLYSRRETVGFELVLVSAVILTQLLYKLSLIFPTYIFIVPAGSWLKLLNLALQLLYTSLIQYLSRLQDSMSSILGLSLVFNYLLQEYDPLSLTSALLPCLINSCIFYYAHCFLNKGKRLPYVNSRQMIEGTVWYIIAIVAGVGERARVTDFYWVF
jgi:hypothetical protein